MSIWKQVLLSILVLVLAAGGWYAFEHRGGLLGGGTETATSSAPRQGGGRGAGAGFGPTLIVSDSVTSDRVADEVRAVGTVLVPRSINVYPQVTAVVTEVLFKAGDAVHANQPLVRLDDADQKVALDLARIALEDTKKTLDRAERLASTNNITQSALQDAQSAERKAEIEVTSADIALSRRTITAPFAGVVGLSALAIGDLVQPSTIVATLDDLSEMKVSFPVPERFAGRVALGQAVTATADSSPTNPVSGTVTAIDSRIDSGARTLKIEATLDAEAARAVGMRPGMSVKASLPFPGEDKLAVSALSIQWDRSGSYVWKLAGESVARVPVTILERQSGRVLVASEDLSTSDRIVVEGLQRLRPGVKVAEAGGGNAEQAENESGAAVTSAARGS